MPRYLSLLVSLLLGVLVAGPVSALALVVLPVRWRGPWVPWSVVLLMVGLVAAWRHGRQPPS